MAPVDELRRILREQPGQVVVIVGAGVSFGAVHRTVCQELTTWDGLLRSGLRRLHELQKITDDERADYERLLVHTNPSSFLTAASLIERELGAPGHGEFRGWLRETVGTFEAHITDPSVLDALAAYHRRGVKLATTNFDLLLEHATNLPTVTWRDPVGVERMLQGTDPQILHLHGAWRWPDSIVLGMTSGAHAQLILRTLRGEHVFLFVGCGASQRDPNLGALLSWSATELAGSGHHHFRVCLDSELAALTRERPDEQHILPLSYGGTYSALADFLRSLLPPGNTIPPRAHHAHAAPTDPLPAVNPAQPSSAAQKPVSAGSPERWHVVLDKFLVDAFENRELYQFFVLALPSELVNALPGIEITREAFCFEAVQVLRRNNACDHAFFEAVRNVRPHRRGEIDTIELACRGSLGLPQAPTPPRTVGPEPERATLSQFALVLDRSIQWREFADALRENPRHFLAIVHGDHRQDLKLFIERTLRWANGTFRGLPPRNHELIKVQCYQDGTCPRTQALWQSRITQAIEDKRIDRGELPAMLATLAERSAALIVFLGTNNGGLRHGPPAGMTLIEHGSFAAALATLVKAIPANSTHPIRILVPVEHVPDESAVDPLLKAIHDLTARNDAVDHLLLQELDFPSWSDVLSSLRLECKRRGYTFTDAELERTFRPTYRNHEACKGTNTHSFAVLGQALSELLDHQIPENTP